MPTFKFTSPEGKQYTVNGPDGATKEQAFSILQQQIAGGAAKPDNGGIPVSADESAFGARNAPAAQPAQPPDSMLGKAFSAIETPLTLATGAIGSVVGPAVGVVKSIATGKYGTQAGVRDAEDTAGKVANALTYQPRTQTAQNQLAVIGKAGDVLDKAGLVGIMPEVNRLAGTAAPMATTAANAGKVGVASADAAVAGKVAQAGNALKPSIPPATLALAQKAQQYDIPLRPDMLTNNKFARIIGDSLEKVPLSGAAGEERQTAFNRAIIGTIGGDKAAAKLTPDVFDAAMKQSGQKIGDIAERTPVPLDKDLNAALAAHAENAAKFETSDVQRVVGSYLDELKAKAGEDGVIPGEAFRKINTKLTTQMRSTSNGDLKHALGELQSDMQDALQRNATETDLPQLLAARKQYAIAKTIEPLVAKSPSGDISPAALMGRVTANGDGKSRMARGNGGEIGDLARIGQQFLKEPNSSNTAERGLAYGVLGGGIATHPVAAAGVYSAANLYNRLGPKAVNALIQPQP